jgi:hypothetical protein
MAIRSAFGADALMFFGQHQGWHVEVKDRAVGIYRARHVTGVGRPSPLRRRMTCSARTRRR